MAETNTYELQGRFDKSVKLAAHLSAYRITANEAERMTPANWLQMSRVLKLANPPSPESVKVVIGILREFETAMAQFVEHTNTPVDIKEIA